MSLPSLPTDNLYKFMTIAGLVVVVAGGIWFRDVRRELTSRVDEIQLKSQVLDIELKHLTEDMERYHQVFKSRLDSLQHGERPTLKEVQNFEDPLRSRQEAVEIKKAEIDHEREILRDNRGARALFVLMCLVGFGITATGLWLWYTRLQIYQDKFVRSGKFRTGIPRNGVPVTQYRIQRDK